MNDPTNPLLPVTYDIVWSVVTVLVIVLFVISLTSIALTAKRLTVSQALVWSLVVIFVPIIGARGVVRNRPPISER